MPRGKLWANIHIRDARTEDFETIAWIRNQSIQAGDAALAADERSPQELRDVWLGMTDREAWLIAESDDIVLGYSLIKAYSERLGYRCSCETSTFVRREFMGRGLGTQLKIAIIDRCKQLGYRHLVAKVLAENKASIEYNCKLGYEVVGTQKQIGYRKGRWLDVTILQLVLEDVSPYKPELG